MSIQFAAENADRVKGLILFGTTPRFTRSEDYPIGLSERALDAMGTNWGDAVARDILLSLIHI